MKKPILTSLACAVLFACSGNPLSGTDPGTGTPEPPAESGVPASLSLNLNAASFVPGDPTITVNLSSQDATALDAVYQRDPSLDRAGYLAYTTQASTSNRYVIAMVKESGSAKAMSVMDAGQFINYYGGTTYARADLYTLPTSGVGPRYNYSGSYVGLLNVGNAAPNGPGGGLNPEQAYITQGRALITADFTNMSISGGVDNRTITNTGLAQAPSMDDFSLFSTGIAADGSFEGDVYIGADSVGKYGGVFAGIEARDVAAVMVFNPYKDQVAEHGLVVLTNCVDAGGPACP